MKQTRHILAATAMAASLTVPLHAQTVSFVDLMVQRLTDEGYEIEEVRRTWLGRIRIEALRGDFEREIVIDPRNGEILRDILEIEDRRDDDSGGPTSTAEDPQSTGGPLTPPPPPGSNSGPGGPGGPGNGPSGGNSAGGLAGSSGPGQGNYDFGGDDRDNNTDDDDDD